MSATAPHTRVYPAATVGWLTDTILFVLYIRSLADRYLVALLVDPIKKALTLSDFQISLLQGPAFAVLYCLCAIPVGLALDRASRRWVLFGCVVVWSAGAASCGLAGSFAALLLARSLVGAGESGFSTGAYSMLGDSFPPSRVSLAMSIFVMGGVMGAGIVFLLGGPLVGAVLGGAVAHWPLMGHFAPWQQAFIVTGVPGIATALLIFAFPEPPRHRAVGASAGGYGEALAYLRLNPLVFSAIMLGFGLVYTVTIALQLWSPSFLARVHGWTPAKVGVTLGVAQMLAACSLPLHGWVVDRMFRAGRADAHLTWCMVCMALALPCAVFAFLTANPWGTVVGFGLYLAFIFSTASMGPAVTQVVTPQALRGRVSALYVLVSGLIAMALGSPLVGLTTDRLFGDPKKVGLSLVLLAALILLPVLALFGAARRPLRALIENPGDLA